MVAPLINAEDWPTVEKLADALERSNAPRWMIRKARAGQYHDYLSDSATPIVDLVRDCKRVGRLNKIVRRAKAGEFDATKAESDLWSSQQTGEMRELCDIMEASAEAGEDVPELLERLKDHKAKKDQEPS